MRTIYKLAFILLLCNDALCQSTITIKSSLDSVLAYKFQSRKEYVDSLQANLTNGETFSELNFSTLTGTCDKEKKKLHEYKVIKLTNRESLVFFHSSDLKGIMTKVSIDSSIWIGRIECLENKTNEYLFSFKTNFILGYQHMILVFTNVTPIFKDRAEVKEMQNINRILILDDSLNFKEMLFLNVNFKEPTTSIKLQYDGKDKKYFVNSFVVNKDFVSSIQKMNIEEILKNYQGYLDSYLYTDQYPISSLGVAKEKSIYKKLSNKMFWMYHENFFLFAK